MPSRLEKTEVLEAAKLAEQGQPQRFNELFAEVNNLVPCDKWGPSVSPFHAEKTDCGHENCMPRCWWPPKYHLSLDAMQPALEKLLKEGQLVFSCHRYDDKWLALAGRGIDARHEWEYESKSRYLAEGVAILLANCTEEK